MSTPQPISQRLTPSVVQRSSPSSSSAPVGPARPPTAGSMDPPTPRPSQLPFPSTSSNTEAPASTITTITEDYSSAQQQQPQQGPFLPFFTLIQDATTSSHFHPTVRYVFSDDEFDPLAILPTPPNQPINSDAPSGLNSLSNSNTAQNPNQATSAPHSGSGSQADVDSNGSGQFGKPVSRRNNERVILVDIAADGQGILSAHSLSPAWQVSGVSVTKAPTWMSDDNSTTTAATATGDMSDGGLMLTIEGVGRGRKKPQAAGLMDAVAGKEKKGPVESLEELVGMYQERLEKLQGVVDWAEGRKGVDRDVGGGEFGS
ncbi:hypothetical protein TWF694_004217 [Orbilia ellipsospora]|uniref:Uncharacterized protein n=1 Tax=Orbilia ellipsospora TaxID=2528407 RepID=A0AAV9WYA8_9PEZI